MHLLLAEWSRLLHRRFTWVMVTLLGAGLVAIAIGFVLTSSPPTDFQRDEAARLAAAAQVRYDNDRAMCLDIERGVVRAPLGKPPYPKNCDFGPRPVTDDFMHYGFVLSGEIESLFLLAGTLLCLFGFLIGASFVGAEWTSGGLTNLLLWRPNRVAVLGAKLTAMLSGLLAASIGYLIAWVGAFWLVAKVRGTVGTFTTGDVISLSLTGVRVLVLVLAVSAVGFALASLGRHTAMALGVFIGYLLVYELGTLIITAIMGTDWPWQLRLSSYVGPWLIKEMELGPGDYRCDPTGCFAVSQSVVTWVDAGMVYGVVLIALVGAAFVTIRRRDVA